VSARELPQHTQQKDTQAEADAQQILQALQRAHRPQRNQIVVKTPMQHDPKNISTYFLFLMLAVSTYFAYVIFKPFLEVIVLAGVFASLLYPVYKWFTRIFKGRENLASLATVISFVLLIVLPIANFIVLLAGESSATYTILQEKLTSGDLNASLARLIEDIRNFQERYFSFVDITAIDLRQAALDISGSLNSFILSAASSLIRGTTQLITNLFFMLLTMYFLFRDGKVFAERLATLTPLSNKYDRKLFDKFREISRTTILSSLLTAIIQAILATIAFAIVGLPAFFLGAATAIAALIPVVGTALVMIPVLVVLAFTGQWGAFVFLAIWSSLLVSLSDNVVRAWFIKGQSQIHPLLVFFSIFGAVAAFGFNGIIFGPVILAMILTVIHIYELEYQDVLER
jgi:predicted PurR-regulated permease PerM